MAEQHIIRCATDAEFDRLSLQQLALAEKVVVAGRVVKDRYGPVGVMETDVTQPCDTAAGANGDLAALSLAWVRSPAYVDLTARQTAILAIVCDEPGTHTVRGLALRLGVSKPVVTRALNSFGRLGLVKRVGDPDDRRVIFAVPTDAGRAARQAMRELAHG